MRRFLPDVADEELDELYLDLTVPVGDERPHVFVGMVASVDGTAVVDGRSAGLGGDADRVAFRRLREHCDAILVGAGTVRVEGYGPPRTHPGSVTRRRARGLADRPTVAVVTNTADLDPAAGLFRDRDLRPVVITAAAAPAERRAQLAEVADVVVAGAQEVDLHAAMALLTERGWRRVLCEGGPKLNGALLAAGLVDELFLTLAPTLVGGPGMRITAGPDLAPVPVELVELRHHRGELLLRYRVPPG